MRASEVTRHEAIAALTRAAASLTEPLDAARLEFALLEASIGVLRIRELDADGRGAERLVTRLREEKARRHRTENDDHESSSEHS